MSYHFCVLVIYIQKSAMIGVWQDTRHSKEGSAADVPLPGIKHSLTANFNEETHFD